MDFKFLFTIFIAISYGMTTRAMEVKIEPKQEKFFLLKYPNKRFVNKAVEFITNYQEAEKKEQWEEFLGRNLKYIAELFIAGYVYETDESTSKKLYNQIQSSPLLKQEIITVINTQNSVGEALLHRARTAHEAKKLIKLGADFKQLSKLQQDPFLATLSRGRPEVSKAILEATVSNLNFEPIL